VEVLAISGHTAAAVTREPNVFYDSEVATVIHRGKEKTSGLVSTKVWAWRGKNADFGEREERKVQELAARFGTTVVSCLNTSEEQSALTSNADTMRARLGATGTHTCYWGCIGDPPG
jgi:hypothetical protein